MNPAQRGPSRWELGLLAAVFLVGAALRLVHLGADVPWDAERSQAPLLDAFWYFEAAAGVVDGSTPEHFRAYDLAVWTEVARSWLRLVGSSLEGAAGLGVVVSLASVLLLWRVTRPGLGPVGALAAAASLAVAYPVVALSRTTLIYGPVTLALLVAAALWLRGGAVSGWRRLAHEAGAWALVLATAAAVRPPALALAGGFVLGHAARVPRLRRPLLALAVAGAGAGLLVLSDPALLDRLLRSLAGAGELGAHTADRVRRYAALGLTPGELVLRLLRWGGEPAAGRGSGLFRIAPAIVALAIVGGALAVCDGRNLTRARRELLLVFGGWWITFVACSLLLDHRPLRYYVVIAPPLATFAVYPGLRLFEGPRPFGATRLRAGLVFGLAGALLGVHLLEHVTGSALSASGTWLAGTAAGVGALVLAGVTNAARGSGPGLGPSGRRALAGALIVGAVLPGAARSARANLRPSWTLREARASCARDLPPGSRLAGPYASVLSLGHPRPRRRAPWIATGPGRLDGTLRRLREAGITHLALDREQATFAQIVPRFRAAGARLDEVARFDLVRPGGDLPDRRQMGARVLLYRVTFSGAPEKSPGPR